jgi:hypothetical protein
VIDRRTFLKGAALTGALAAPSPLRAALLQESSAPFIEVLPEQVVAVKRALDYLQKIQSRSGSIGSQAPLAFTALAGLAWMAGGSTPSRGPYALNVMNALRYVLKCSRGVTGYLNEGAGRMAGGSGMHGHGFALLFLAELYGMCGDLSDSIGDDSIREAIVRGVQVTEKAQHSQGGWTYDPQPSAHEGSVTVTQVQALRAARNIGVSVSQKVVDKGISYIKKSTNPDGTIMYMLGQGSHASYPLTAAGACVYSYFGLYDDPQGQKCMKALYDFITGKRAGQNAHFDSYATFYAGQACFFMKRRDPRFWTEGYSRIRKVLLTSQGKNGAWMNDGYEGNFGTPCAALVLQIPYRTLPIFQD